jgi:hypothetical protein
MQRFEYRVIPAPTRGKKAKGLRTVESRFSNAMEILLNDMAADGWIYERAEMLPNEERSGLTGTAKNWRNILIFRRELAQSADSDVQSSSADLAITQIEIDTPAVSDSASTDPTGADSTPTPDTDAPIADPTDASDQTPKDESQVLISKDSA